MSSKGVKRASSGADLQKNPLADVEVSDADALKLSELQRDIARTELILERRAQEKLLPVYEKRRAVVKAIPKFWAVALMNHSMFAMHAQHNADQVALSYLEDLWIVRDPIETRCFTLEFYFKENPFFKNKVLKKEYKWEQPPAAANEKPDAEGITQSMLEFSWERDVRPLAFKIDWKDDSKNLTKQHPLVQEDDDDFPSEYGSFFNYFDHAQDPFDLGVLVANDVFPEAIEYFLGQAGGEELDETDDEEDEEDDDEDEIDLEKPRPKKQKHV